MKQIIIQAHTSVINVVKFNLDGDLLFSAGNDKNVNVYSGLDFERLGNCECSSAAKTIAISEDSSLLYVGTGSGTVEVFEIANGKKIGLYEIQDTRIRHVELSYGGKQLMVVYTNYSNAGFVQFFNVKQLLEHFKKNEESSKFKGVIQQLPGSFSQISYGLCNQYMIGITEKGTLYKFGGNGEILKEKKIFDEGVGVTFARDYGFVAISGNLGVKLFDPETLEEIRFFKQDFPMRGLAISPLYNCKAAKRHIVMGGGTPAREAALLKAGGTQIHVMNMVSSEALAHIGGHFSPVNSLTFFRDGGGIVSGAEEGRIFVFRFDKTYWEEARFN